MNAQRPKKSSSDTSEQQGPVPSTLNDLPQNVIDEILSLLPIKDAVGTSLISRLWRSRWKSMPDLRFCNTSERFVTQALLLHSGNIRAFEFSGRLSPPSVDGWLIALSARAADTLHSLFLHFCNLDGEYHLHPSAFSFRHLTHVSLSNCRITPARDLSGFKHLVRIELLGLHSLDGGRLSSFLSASPCLQDVSLLSVSGWGCLKIHGSNLRRLYHEDVDFDDFALGSCPRLEHAGIDLRFVEGDESYGGEDLGAAPWLALGRHGLKMLAMYGVPERNPINFDKLSSMTLCVDFTDLRSISATVSLIKSCPNLKDLAIESSFIHKYRIEDCEKIWGEQVNFDIFPKLQTAKFHGIMLEDSELELVRLILETSRLLQAMELYFDASSERDRESAIIKILEFRRASNKVRMLFDTYF